ncbi:hypothetical protein IJH74_00305 [Candidatus Saccharibacteria bacterium]|nr:hypothetical protein [Candidatus Saccharibacteria bacterium]
MQITGKNGSNGHRITESTLSINCRIKTIVPAINIPILTIAPIIRETNWSRNALNLSPKAALLVPPAEICLKGVNKVFISDPIEKKSTVSRNLFPSFAIKIFQPFKYHQVIISATIILSL